MVAALKPVATTPVPEASAQSTAPRPMLHNEPSEHMIHCQGEALRGIARFCTGPHYVEFLTHFDPVAGPKLSPAQNALVMLNFIDVGTRDLKLAAECHCALVEGLRRELYQMGRSYDEILPLIADLHDFLDAADMTFHNGRWRRRKQ